MRRQRLWKTLYWVLAVLPLLAAVLAWPRIPEYIQIAPEVTAASGRNGVFAMPAANLIFAVIAHFALDRMARAMADRSAAPGTPLDIEQVMLGLKVYMMAFLSAICLCVVYGYYSLDSGSGTAALMGRASAIMLGLGTLIFARGLPRASKRSTLALRWSYTEKSDQVWFRTHRLGHRLLTGTGAAALAAGILMEGTNAFLVSVMLPALVLITLYLYAKRIYEDEFFK